MEVCSPVLQQLKVRVCREELCQDWIHFQFNFQFPCVRTRVWSGWQAAGCDCRRRDSSGAECCRKERGTVCVGVVMEGSCNKGMTECVLMTEVTLAGHFMFIHTRTYQSVSEPVIHPSAHQLTLHIKCGYVALLIAFYMCLLISCHLSGGQLLEFLL